jgi:hypothetical protein
MSPSQEKKKLFTNVIPHYLSDVINPNGHPSYIGSGSIWGLSCEDLYTTKLYAVINPNRQSPF